MKTVVLLAKIVFIAYTLLCAILYLVQEKLIFFPQKLSADYRFIFPQPFIERYFTTKDKKLLHGLLFSTPKARGLIFYLHGNAGSLQSWGEVSNVYTDLQYDLFMLDYRSYGKSQGSIRNENQLYEDIQLVYDSLKHQYQEQNIIVLGYSIGTGPAARLASTNHPRLLILQAPYFSLTDMMRHHYPFIPGFILKYKFQTNLFIQQCTMPVVIFHGNKDEVIYYGSSLKLKALFKPVDTLITLNGQSHNGITDNPDYLSSIKMILHRDRGLDK